MLETNVKINNTMPFPDSSEMDNTGRLPPLMNLFSTESGHQAST